MSARRSSASTDHTLAGLHAAASISRVLASMRCRGREPSDAPIDTIVAFTAAWRPNTSCIRCDIGCVRMSADTYAAASGRRTRRGGARIAGAPRCSARSNAAPYKCDAAPASRSMRAAWRRAMASASRAGSSWYSIDCSGMTHSYSPGSTGRRASICRATRSRSSSGT